MFEYATLIVIIIGVIIVMQPYIFRGIMGKWRQAGDALGFGRTYEPGETVVYDKDGYFPPPTQP